MKSRFLVFSDSHWRDSCEIPDFFLKLIPSFDGVFITGDIEEISVYETLRAYNNFFAVCGNCDGYELRRALPQERNLQVCGVKIGMIHGRRRGEGYLAELADTFNDAGLILFGHSHIPFNEKRYGRHFFNPGSISCPRGGYPPSYGILSGENGMFDVKHVFLGEG